MKLSYYKTAFALSLLTITAGTSLYHAELTAIPIQQLHFGFLFDGPVPIGVTSANGFQFLQVMRTPVGVLENSVEVIILTILGIPTIVFPDVASAVADLKAGTIVAFFSKNSEINAVAAEDPTLISLNDVVLPASKSLDRFRYETGNTL